MERTGGIPICLSGIQFHFLSSSSSSTDSKRRVEESRDQSLDYDDAAVPYFQGSARAGNKQGGDKSMIAASGPQLGTKGGVESDTTLAAASQKSGQKELIANVQKFHALMTKGMEKQMNSMTKFYKRTVDRFPEKVHK